MAFIKQSLLAGAFPVPPRSTGHPSWACQSPLGSALLQLSKKPTWILPSFKPGQESSVVPVPKLYLPYTKPSPGSKPEIPARGNASDMHISDGSERTSLSPFSWGCHSRHLAQDHIRNGKKGLNCTEQRHFLGENKFCGSFSRWRMETKVVLLLSV